MKKTTISSIVSTTRTPVIVPIPSDDGDQKELLGTLRKLFEKKTNL